MRVITPYRQKNDVWHIKCSILNIRNLHPKKFTNCNYLPLIAKPGCSSNTLSIHSSHMMAIHYVFNPAISSSDETFFLAIDCDFNDSKPTSVDPGVPFYCIPS